MQHVREFNWTNGQGHRIYAVEWPVESARAVLGLIHGIGEHARRYDPVAAWFNARGIAVVGYDRQGFGRSEGRRGHADKYSDYVDEVAHLLVECERRYPDLPAFLYGHSMGGHLLLRYLTRRHPNVSGAVVSAPHIRLAFAPNRFLVGVGKLMRNVVPTLTQPNDLDLSTLSRTPGVGEAYAADPHTHNKVSARMGMDMLDSAAALDQYAGGVKVPVLIMHGTDDRITSAAGSQAFAERNPSNVTYKAWPGLYHELHFEPEREEVLTFALSWLEERITDVDRPPQSV